jgi:paraquat-inducible protein B
LERRKEARVNPKPARLQSWLNRWPGLVWAVPLAALIVVGYLGLEALAKQGVDVVVTFNSAHGARAGDTPVVYKGVRIGVVTNIEISRDARQVDMTLRLVPRARNALREGAKFWMIGTEPSLTDLSSLTAVVSGVSIGAAPGTGAPRRRFVGQDTPPPVPPGEPGSYYILQGANVGATRVGAGIYYQGLEVGRVTRVTLDPPLGFRLTVFVRAPYDRLVKPDSLFFSTKALDVTLTATGLAASLGPGNSALAGGVEFDTSAEAQGEPRSPSGATFRLYEDKSAAQLGPAGPLVLYRTTVNDGGRLKPGAPVTLEGFPVGRVVRRDLSVDAAQGLAVATVQLALAPERLGLEDRTADGEALSPHQWRERTDPVLERLIRRGYRLQLVQTPAMLGPEGLAFARMDEPPPSAPGRVADGWVPSAAAPAVSDVIARADTLLRHAEAVPLADIGKNLRQLTARLNGLAGSPQVAESLVHLNSTLANLDQITGEVRPQAGPLVAKLLDAAQQLDLAAAAANRALGGSGATQDANLPDTLRQVTAAARALRSLADDLDRHPEAVLRGKPAKP